jgi:hypothetical protein
MMVNKNMATSTAPIRVVAGSVEILRCPDTFPGSAGPSI